MYANYHTHTYRCNHATGTEKEYVERAIEKGLKILGFSDHTPYPFPKEYHSGMRMRVDELPDYVRTVENLKDEYKSDIEIHIGLEVEYYPRHFDELLKLVEDYPIEYFLLAQHHIGNEYDVEAGYCGMPTHSDDKLRQYVRQAIEGMETGKFLYLAHPDLIAYEGDMDLYDEEMRRLCLAAREHDLPLELNFLGLTEGRNYPFKRFWNLASELEMDVIYGCDAHRVDRVMEDGIVERADHFLEGMHLHLIEEMKLPAHV
ncbi:MAG: histidinol-phosphatase [Lachnospiraceae bacterium]|nr:histidinol-phosphatase [Lachnospiraceae bacterium]